MFCNVFITFKFISLRFFVGYSELLDKHLEKSLNTKIYPDIRSHDLNNLIEFQPDIIYTTRIQKERRHFNQDQNIIIDNEFLEKMPEDTILMHPLPRNNELSIEFVIFDLFSFKLTAFDFLPRPTVFNPIFVPIIILFLFTKKICCKGPSEAQFPHTRSSCK